MSTRVTRACDGCRVRKVRCNGSLPCWQCAHLNLACKYAPPPGRRKPGVRGRLVQQLRSSQQAEAQGQLRPLQPQPQPQPQPNGNTNRHNHHHRPNQTASSTARSSATSPSSGGSNHSPPAVTSIAGIVNSEPDDAALTTSLPATPSPASCNAWPHHTMDYFLSYLSLYEEQVYTVNPVITTEEMRASIHNMHADLADRALVYAFAAVTINLTQTIFTNAADVLTEVATLMNLSIQIHRQLETLYDNSTAWTSPHAGPSAASVKFGPVAISFRRIMTCVFLEICMMAFKRWDRSFMLLREAIAMIQVLNAHQYDNTTSDGTTSNSASGTSDDKLNTRHSGTADANTRICMLPRDIARLRRVYWQVYIHERFLSVVTGLPCIQPSLKTVPIHDPSIPPHVDLGFNRLIHLFRVLDGPFLAHWTAHKDPSLPATSMTAQWVESKQAELDRDEDCAAATECSLRALARHVGGSSSRPPCRPKFTEVQHVDLFVTRVWLRTLVWQFALHHGLLRSAPPRNTHEGLSLHFPAQRLSSQLRQLVARLDNLTSVVTHGSGILQKLFEITSTVADVLALPLGPGQTQEEARARLEDFEFLVRFLFSFERIEKSQRDYLREKLAVLGRQYTIVDFGHLAGDSPNT